MQGAYLKESETKVYLMFLELGQSRPLFIYFHLFNRADSK